MTEVGVDLSGPRRVHIVAVGGTAMSAIARLLLQLGHRVSGSDVRATPTLETLRREGVDVHVGHAPENVPLDAAVVIRSTAVRADNPELVVARARGIPVWSRADAMAYLVALRPKSVVVSGTHGKTTTTSMVATMLERAGMHPSFFIGGTPIWLGTNARFDEAGEWFVVEGDESDRSILAYRRDAVLVTNIEADHLEHWDDDFATLVAGFEEFVDGAPGPRLLCVDDPVTAELAAARPDAITYGYSPAARVQARDYEQRPGGAAITLVEGGDEVGRVALRLRGRDMAQNATGAAALAHAIGVPWDVVVATLADFEGVGRRFQHRSTFHGVDLYDDYAHTPTEIATTLARAREGAWKRVIAVCQPHRYSRVSRHWQEYADVFADADVVVITALDGAFEEPIAGVDAQLVVDAIRQAHPEMALEYIPEWDALADVPWRVAQPGDIVVTLGCGTITEAHALWEREGARRGSS